MKIRPAVPADDDTIWAMLEPVFRAGETYALDPEISRPDALAYWTGGTHAAYLAEAETALGTYYLCPNQGGGGAHVANAGFVSAVPRRGVARMMLDHALATARDEGFRAMQFNFVVATNTRALALWASAGFREVGRLPGAFCHPAAGFVDALVLWRDL